jgi:hypothetical protein
MNSSEQFSISQIKSLIHISRPDVMKSFAPPYLLMSYFLLTPYLPLKET